MGAASGGALALVSRFLPGARKERLYKKFAKRYKKCQSIDRSKAIAAAIEENAREAKKAAREKHKTAHPILKALKVYRIAKGYHKTVERLGRKAKRYYARKFVASADKAIETKAQLNLQEAKSGKTMALAGYIEKRKKAQAKLAAGKMSKEDYDDKMQDYEEDFADLPGGQEGFSKTSNGHATYDYEASELIGKVQEAQRSKGMNMMMESIKRRNSKAVEQPVERVYRDPEQVEAQIAKLRTEGKEDEANGLQASLDELKRQRAEYVAWAEAHGEPVDEPVDVNEDEMSN